VKRLLMVAVAVFGVLAPGVESAGASTGGVQAITIVDPAEVDVFTFQNRGSPADFQICAAASADPRPYPLPGAPLAQLILSQPGQDQLTTVTTGFFNDYTACLHVDEFIRGTITLSYAGDVQTFTPFQICMPYSSSDSRSIAVTAPARARSYCKT
jgi:hypothetical protein